MLRILMIGYLIIAHGVGAWLLYEHLTTDPPGRVAQAAFHRMSDAHYKRRDRNVQPGAVLFFGASTVQGLVVSDLAPRAVNFGIGGETMAQLAKRAPGYRSLQTARAVVIWAGYNDLRRRPSEAVAVDMRRLLEQIAPTVKIVVLGVQRVQPPDWSESKTLSRNAEIEALNARYANICKGMERCQFLDTNRILEEEAACREKPRYEDDGIHLSVTAYRCLRDSIELVLKA